MSGIVLLYWQLRNWLNIFLLSGQLQEDAVGMGIEMQIVSDPFKL